MTADSQLTTSTTATKQLAGAATWYSLGHSIRFVATAVQIPILATALSPAQLGLFTVIQAFAAIPQIVAAGGLPTGLFRQICDYAPRADLVSVDRALTTAFLGAIGLSIVTAFVTVLLGWSALLFGFPEEWFDYSLFAAVLAVVAIPRLLWESALRAEGRARLAGVYASVLSVLSLGSTFVVLILFDAGVLALLIGSVVVNALTSALAIPRLLHAVVHVGFSIGELRAMLRFGLPIVPTALINWAIDFSDRLFLAGLAGLGAAGVYGLSGRIARILQAVVFAGLQTAWDPWAFTNHEQPGSERLYGRLTTYLALVALAGVVSVAAAVAPLLEILGIADTYGGADSLVFFLGLAAWLGLMRHIALVPTGIQRRTALTLVVWVPLGLASVALNVLLIPRFGVHGAASAAVLTQLFGLCAAAVLARRLWVIEYEWGRLAALLAAGVAGYALALALPDVPPLVGLVLRPAVALVPLIVVAAVFVLTGSEERAAVRRTVLGIAAAARPTRAPEAR
jgi:O-antigen/teichoic acid export membrane protein